MKVLIASLIFGGALVPAADLPDVGADECAVVSVDVELADPTLMSPDPDATALRLVVYCGHTVRSGETSTKTDRALKVIDVDRDTAELIVTAAGDLLAADDTFTP